MPKTPSALQDSLQRARASMNNQVLAQAIRGLAGGMTMGELADQFASTEFSDAYRDMTMNAFFDAWSGSGAKSSSGGVNTRTLAGRAEFDAAVSSCLERLASAGSEQIRNEVGGSPAQIRESMVRLTEEGLVSKTGEKRATRYIWKGKGKKGK